MPVVTIDDVGAQKDRAKAQLFDAAADFVDSVIDVERRDHAGADHFPWIGLAEVVKPIVISARESGRKVRLQVGYAEQIQAAARVKYRHVDAFFGHGIELNLRRPAALIMRLEQFLVFVKNMAGRWQSSPWRVNRTAPGTTVRTDQAQIAHMIRAADGRARRESFVDVALPEIGRLQDVHVAIENLVATLCHGNLRVFKPVNPSIRPFDTRKTLLT